MIGSLSYSIKYLRMKKSKDIKYLMKALFCQH
jgi:hypothetical protein